MLQSFKVAKEAAPSSVLPPRLAPAITMSKTVSWDKKGKHVMISSFKEQVMARLHEHLPIRELKKVAKRILKGEKRVFGTTFQAGAIAPRVDRSFIVELMPGEFVLCKLVNSCVVTTAEYPDLLKKYGEPAPAGTAFKDPMRKVLAVEFDVDGVVGFEKDKYL